MLRNEFSLLKWKDSYLSKLISTKKFSKFIIFIDLRVEWISSLYSSVVIYPFESLYKNLFAGKGVLYSKTIVFKVEIVKSSERACLSTEISRDYN